MELTVKTKICRTCGGEKISADFGIDNRSSDGLLTYCKECMYRRRRGERTPLPGTEFIKRDSFYELKIVSKAYGEVNALVDAEDLDRVMQYRWHVNSEFYASAKINGVQTRMHRFIMNAPSNKIVDHKNHDTLDNRKSNLRICDKNGNCQNARKLKPASSKYKGVRKRGNAYETRIRYNNKNIYVGYFKSEIEAAKAYDLVAIKYHGEYAVLNFKNEEENYDPDTIQRKTNQGPGKV